MGHADINTTMDIYAEVTEAKKENQWRIYQETCRFSRKESMK